MKIINLLLLFVNITFGFKSYVNSRQNLVLYLKKITPNDYETMDEPMDKSMDEYLKVCVNTIKTQSPSLIKLEGKELLEIIIKKWGVAYDVQLQKSKTLGEGSENIYLSIMWKYFGQKSFSLSEREYLEHLEALSRYITAIDKVQHVKDKIKESRKRPNAQFGYAVLIPLDVDPNSANTFFKDLPYE